MQTVRTDLALDLLRGNKAEPVGIRSEKETVGPLTLERVRVPPEAAEDCGKPAGEYLTVGTGRLWMDDADLFREKVFAFRDILTGVLEKTPPLSPSVLVAGLGNRHITADSVGPVAAEHLVITRHVRGSAPLLFRELGLFDLCAVTPGVLGETGIETADVLGGITGRVRPGLVIAIDALASLSLERLVTTVQITDTGIRPGSGVGNARPEITKDSLGIPVIAIGVPTVVDAAAFVPAPTPGKAWEDPAQGGTDFFVTPKESDRIIRFMGAFLGYGINLAFNRSLSWENMLSLIG